jgi:hypothetical protein
VISALLEVFYLTPLSFLLLAQKKGAKKKAADFDADHYSLDHHATKIGV